jgi:hypothetical protein
VCGGSRRPGPADSDRAGETGIARNLKALGRRPLFAETSASRTKREPTRSYAFRQIESELLELHHTSKPNEPAGGALAKFTFCGTHPVTLPLKTHSGKLATSVEQLRGK